MKTCFPLLLLLHSVVAFSQTAQSLVNVFPDSTDNMVFIPGGTFQMGSEDGEGDENPVHIVTVSSFYMSKYELTVGEFQQFVAATGYQTDADKAGWCYLWTNKGMERKEGANWRCDAMGNLRPVAENNHPVINVSWNDAVAYCQWKSKTTGKNYRLPTEAEWEYAAGGGDPNIRNRTIWAGASDENQLRQFINYDGKKGADQYDGTAPVGSLQPNALGLHHMNGNVLEWCSDWYGTYSSNAQTNPKGEVSGTNRVLRGGGWNYSSKHCRLASRSSGAPVNRLNNFGFRLVRE
jgi:formylglycine-generating enzyme required for sulfatase activity